MVCVSVRRECKREDVGFEGACLLPLLLLLLVLLLLLLLLALAAATFLLVLYHLTPSHPSSRLTTHLSSPPSAPSFLPHAHRNHPVSFLH